MKGNGKTTKKVAKPAWETEDTPELKNILEAIDKYIEVNRGQVNIFASFIAFDAEKIQNNEEDVTIQGSDRLIAYGDLESIRISLNELRDVIEDEQEEGFVNL